MRSQPCTEARKRSDLSTDGGNLKKVGAYLFLFMLFLSKYILLLLLTITSSTTGTNYYYLSLIFMLISPNPMCSISSALRRSGSVYSGR